MPSFIGAIIVESSSGTITTGDFNNISPKSGTKTFAGGGGLNTGDFNAVISGVSLTNTVDANAIDQSNGGSL
ncbi:MAG: spore germination protein [Bacillaceae bacterium]